VVIIATWASWWSWQRTQSGT